MPSSTSIRDRLKMISISLVLVILVGTAAGMAAPEPAPQGFFGSLFGGSRQLEPTGENLMKAIEEGDLASVKDLVSRGANIDFGDGYPLGGAAKNGNLEILKYLLQSGANPNGTNDANRNVGYPLQQAGFNNHVEVIDILLKAGATVTSGEFGVSVLDRAVENGHLEAVAKLLEASADPDKGGGYTLLLAAKGGHLDVVKALIQAGANVSAGGGWILGTAADEGQLAIVQTLIEAGVTPDEIDNAMKPAAGSGHLEVVKLLSQKGGDPNINAPLPAAATKGHLEVVRFLLEAGASVDYEDDLKSPIHLAAANGHIDVIKLLVGYGSAINKASKKDLWWDFTGGSSTEYGNGWTVMHVAARFGYIIIKDLMDLGADINLQDQLGRTPLEISVIYDKLHVAEEILKFCADPSLTNNQGHTVLDVAKIQAAKNDTDLSKMRNLILVITDSMSEKLLTLPYNEQTVNTLSKEFEALLAASSTLQERLNETLASIDANVAISNIMQENARKKIVQRIEGHNCQGSMEDYGTIPIGSEYLAKCECILGKGPIMTFAPVMEGQKCPPIPLQEEAKKESPAEDTKPQGMVA